MMDNDPYGDRFAPDLERLLAPIPGPSPSGPSMRYDPAYLQIAQARHEDDATLPMGEWERPLKKADWNAVASYCTALLGSGSKDLQLAAWLCEAWIRLHRIDGFNAAVDLLTGLVDRYWDTLYPLIEDGDADARVAPMVWLNENLPFTLKLHVPLVTLPDRQPASVTLAEWDRMPSGEPGQKRDEANKDQMTREQLIAHTYGPNLHWLSDLRIGLEGASQKWDGLSRALDAKLALDAPSLGKVAELLRQMQRAVNTLLDGRDPRLAATAAAAVAQAAASAAAAAPVPEHAEELPMSNDTASAAVPAGPIASREDAYRMLEAAAAYLQRTEPHSPTPYLVKRAVTWGRMSLADLMQEIVREEGDLNRYFSLLGIDMQQRE